MKRTTFPTVKKSSLLGNIYEYKQSPIDCYQNWEQQYGDTFYFTLLNRKILYTSNIDRVKYILQDNHKNYRKNLAYRKLSLLLGNGLFTNEGNEWLKQRRQIQPFFNKKSIDHYFEIFEKVTAETIHRNEHTHLLSFLTNITLKIISKTTLNIDVERSEVIEKNLPFALKFMINRITQPPNAPIWFPSADNRQFKKSVKSIDQYLQELIESRSHNSSQDILSMFLEAREQGYKISDKQIRDELITIFLAGHETTAVATFWLAIYVEQHPECVAKIRAEFQRVLGSSPLSPSHFKELTYTYNVIQETLRLASPVWVVGRESIQSDEFVDEKQSVIFSPYLIHRNTQFWDNPYDFNPDRFLNLTEKAAYLPFGSGPRICVGNNFSITELLVFINEFYVKRHLKLDVPQDHIFEFDYSLTLRPKNDLTFSF